MKGVSTQCNMLCGASDVDLLSDKPLICEVDRRRRRRASKESSIPPPAACNMAKFSRAGRGRG